MSNDTPKRKHEPGFAIIDKEWRTPELADREVRVLAVLKATAFDEKEDEDGLPCWETRTDGVSEAQIARETGKTGRAVRAIIKSLKAKGIIERFSGDGVRQVRFRIYVFRIYPPDTRFAAVEDMTEDELRQADEFAKSMDPDHTPEENVRGRRGKRGAIPRKKCAGVNALPRKKSSATPEEMCPPAPPTDNTDLVIQTTTPVVENRISEDSLIREAQSLGVTERKIKTLLAKHGRDMMRDCLAKLRKNFNRGLKVTKTIDAYLEGIVNKYKPDGPRPNAAAYRILNAPPIRSGNGSLRDHLERMGLPKGQ